MTPVMTILDYLDANFAMWQPWGHDIIKGHQNVFLISLHRKKYSSAYDLIVFSSSRRIEWYTFWPWGHMTWGQLVTLTLWGHHIYILWCVSTRGSRWYCYFFSSFIRSKVIGKNTSLSSNVATLTFFTPETSFLTWPKNDLSENCSPYLTPFTTCL